MNHQASKERQRGRRMRRELLLGGLALWIGRRLG